MVLGLEASGIKDRRAGGMAAARGGGRVAAVAGGYGGVAIAQMGRGGVATSRGGAEKVAPIAIPKVAKSVSQQADMELEKSRLLQDTSELEASIEELKQRLVVAECNLNNRLVTSYKEGYLDYQRGLASKYPVWYEDLEKVVRQLRIAKEGLRKSQGGVKPNAYSKLSQPKSRPIESIAISTFSDGILLIDTENRLSCTNPDLQNSANL